METLELKSKLTNSLDFLKSEFAQIRTGKPNPSFLENIPIEVYSSRMTIKEVASINISNPQIIFVTPWDKSILRDIDKAIRNSGLNLNPVVDNDFVRVPIPPLSEERRRELTKLVTIKVEDIKQVMRNHRQERMKHIEKEFNDKNIGEDEKFRLKEEVEKLVKEFVSKAEELGNAKKDDIMTI